MQSYAQIEKFLYKEDDPPKKSDPPPRRTQSTNGKTSALQRTQQLYHPKKGYIEFGPGARFQVVDMNATLSSGKWKVVKLELDGEYYYISRSSFDGVFTSANQPPPSRQALGQVKQAGNSKKQIPSPTETKGNKYALVSVSAGSSLNLRAGPSTSYEILDQLKRNERVRVLEKKGKWRKIVAGERIAWVSSDYLIEDLTLEDVEKLLDAKSKTESDVKIKTTGARHCTGDPGHANCLKFDASKYKSGKEFFEKQIKNTSVQAMKKEFLDYFAPLAVYLQSHTGYPASLLLAQFAADSAGKHGGMWKWGANTSFREANNIAGHTVSSSSLGKVISMTLGPDNWDITLRKGPARSAREGGHYYMYDTLMHSALRHIYLLLWDPNTSRAYSSLRQHMSKLGNSEIANPFDVIPLLGSYAVDPNYEKNLGIYIRANNLTRFDRMTVCGGGE